MKAGGKSAMTPKVDWTGPDAVEQFRRAAKTFGAKVSQAQNPQKAARALLVREGILTSKGRLTSKYR